MGLIYILYDTLKILRIFKIKNIEIIIFITLGIISSIFSIFTIYVIFNFASDVISGSSNLVTHAQESNQQGLLKSVILGENWIIFSVIIINFFIQMITIFYLQKFSQNISHKMSLKLINQFMGMNFISRNNSISDMVRSVVASESQQYATLIIMPILEIIKSASLLSIGIFVIGLNIQNKSLIAILSVVIIFSIYFILTKKIVSRLGKIRTASVEKRLSLTEATINNLKYIKAYTARERISNLFEELSRKLHNAIVWSMVISLTPKHFIELLIFVSITCLIIASGEAYSYFDGINMEGLVLSSLIALRVLPEMQKIFNGSARIIYGKPISDGLLILTKKLGVDSLEKNSNITTKYTKKNTGISVSNLGIKNSKNGFLIQDINFNLDEGNILLIKGHSGIGKSTILEVIMNMRKLETGLISYMKSGEEEFGFSYVGQEFHLFPGSIKNTLEILLGTGLDNFDSKISDFMFKMKLIRSQAQYKDFLNRDIEKLSGGERQRLSIIISLVSPQKFMLLDEPTSNLDINAKILVAKIINKVVRKNNKCAIIVSHDNCFNEIADYSMELK